MDIEPARLRSQVQRALESNGASRLDAELVAELLVDADLSGYDSHGVVKVPGYLDKLRSGQIDPSAEISTSADGPAYLALDAAWGFGQSAAITLIDRLVDRAARAGSACGTVLRCNDLGRLAPFVMRAAERGMIAMLMVNDAGFYPQVAPWQGTEALLGTNPIAFAAPVDGAEPLVFDLSTSTVAAGKLLLAAERGQPAPPGTVIDRDGAPSADPSVIATQPKTGSLLPLGAPIAGHKGYALGLMVDVLAGALTGTGTSADDPDRHIQGVYAFVVDTGVFTSPMDYDERIQRLRSAVHATPTVEGVERVEFPGERAARSRREHAASTITIDDDLWSRLLASAHDNAEDARETTP